MLHVINLKSLFHIEYVFSLRWMLGNGIYMTKEAVDIETTIFVFNYATFNTNVTWNQVVNRSIISHYIVSVILSYTNSDQFYLVFYLFKL